MVVDEGAGVGAEVCGAGTGAGGVGADIDEAGAHMVSDEEMAGEDAPPSAEHGGGKDDSSSSSGRSSSGSSSNESKDVEAFGYDSDYEWDLDVTRGDQGTEACPSTGGGSANDGDGDGGGESMEDEETSEEASISDRD
jgi:hypothetical protein